MLESLLDLLRCPFCGGRLSLIDNDALAREGASITSGVLGCECCAFPIVAGIPVLLADDATRAAMHGLEEGRAEEALISLLDLEGPQVAAFRKLLARGVEASFRDWLAVLSPHAEATYFLHRFSDPTYVLAEELVRAVGSTGRLASARALDLCGGAGHLTRALAADGSRETVLADLHFWKLWLAARIIAPGCLPVCCDANAPLPFTSGAFGVAVLSDAFPYVWHKRLLAGEMSRIAAPDGVLLLPHLHNSLGDNFSAGMTLTPASYQALFHDSQPRLFSDARLLNGILETGAVDLADEASAEALGAEPSLTLIASRDAGLFRSYPVDRKGSGLFWVTVTQNSPDPSGASRTPGELTINPLYQVERSGDELILTLVFPTQEYEEEFGACRRYLPDCLTVRADLSGGVDAAHRHYDAGELRRRRIVLNAPRRYC